MQGVEALNAIRATGDGKAALQQMTFEVVAKPEIVFDQQQVGGARHRRKVSMRIFHIREYPTNTDAAQLL